MEDRSSSGDETDSDERPLSAQVQRHLGPEEKVRPVLEPGPW
jgi:hypothetical protein